MLRQSPLWHFYQSVLSLILENIEKNRILIIDDFYLIEEAFGSQYPAAGIIPLLAKALRLTSGKQKSIILLNSQQIVGSRITLRESNLKDYQHFFKYFLGEKIGSALDIKKIYSSVSFMDALLNICLQSQLTMVLRSTFLESIQLTHYRLFDANIV